MTDKVISLDMDDTLIPTHELYEEAKEEFQEYMARNFGVDKDKALEIMDRIDQENVKDLGFSPERFPSSMVDALEALVENPTEEEKEQVYSIGDSVFLSEEEYRERGFLDGAKKLLETSYNLSDRLIMVTAGPKEIQSRKVHGLDIMDMFDEIHYATKAEGKAPFLEKERKTYGGSTLAHVGNSITSDVKPALNTGWKAVYICHGKLCWISSEKDRKYLEKDNVVTCENLHETPETISRLL